MVYKLTSYKLILKALATCVYEMMQNDFKSLRKHGHTVDYRSVCKLNCHPYIKKKNTPATTKQVYGDEQNEFAEMGVAHLPVADWPLLILISRGGPRMPTSINNFRNYKKNERRAH